MTVTELNNKYVTWSLSVATQGEVVGNLDAIKQCIDIILHTTKGTDPFRPEFGTNIQDWVDSPINSAIPNITREIIQAITTYEKRVELQTVKPLLDGDAALTFELTYKVIDSELIDTLTVTFDG